MGLRKPSQLFEANHKSCRYKRNLFLILLATMSSTLVERMQKVFLDESTADVFFVVGDPANVSRRMNFITKTKKWHLSGQSTSILRSHLRAKTGVGSIRSDVLRKIQARAKHRGARRGSGCLRGDARVRDQRTKRTNFDLNLRIQTFDSLVCLCPCEQLDLAFFALDCPKPWPEQRFQHFGFTRRRFALLFSVYPLPDR